MEKGKFHCRSLAVEVWHGKGGKEKLLMHVDYQGAKDHYNQPYSQGLASKMLWKMDENKAKGVFGIGTMKLIYEVR